MNTLSENILDEPRISPVNNLSSIITATTIQPARNYDNRAGRYITLDDIGERFVITKVDSKNDSRPYAIYKERLFWDKVNQIWKHSQFYDGYFRSTYIGAMRNLLFRDKGIAEYSHERSDKIVAI